MADAEITRPPRRCSAVSSITTVTKGSAPRPMISAAKSRTTSGGTLNAGKARDRLRVLPKTPQCQTKRRPRTVRRHSSSRTRKGEVMRGMIITAIRPIHRFARQSTDHSFPYDMFHNRQSFEVQTRLAATSLEQSHNPTSGAKYPSRTLRPYCLFNGSAVPSL